jgi:hypothetical protein
MTTTPAPTPPETAKAEPRTWKPTTAGILTIVMGAIALVAEIIYLTSGNFGIFAGIPFIEASANPNGVLFATSAIAIVGGIFALLRKIWWLAVVGAIFSMFFSLWPILVIGIISSILLALSRKEFKGAMK